MERKFATDLQMTHVAPLRPRALAGWGSILARSVAAGAVYSAANALSRFDTAWENAAVYLVTGTLTCLALAPFVLHSRLSRRWSALTLWAAVLSVRVVGLGIEGALFRPATAPNAIAAAVSGAVVTLVFAACAVWLLAPPSASGGAASPSADSARRGWWGWTWRALAVGLAYFVFYFVFGSANALLYTRSFYENNPVYGLALPPVGTIVIAESIRGPLFGLGALLLAWMTAAPRRPLALWLGTALFVVGSAAAYIETVFRAMPLGFNIATLIELFLQNFLTGVVAAYLLAEKRQS